MNQNLAKLIPSAHFPAQEYGYFLRCVCAIACEGIGPRDIVADFHLGRWFNMKASATLAFACFFTLLAVFKMGKLNAGVVALANMDWVDPYDRAVDILNTAAGLSGQP